MHSLLGAVTAVLVAASFALSSPLNINATISPRGRPPSFGTINFYSNDDCKSKCALHHNCRHDRGRFKGNLGQHHLLDASKSHCWDLPANTKSIGLRRQAAHGWYAGITVKCAEWHAEREASFLSWEEYPLTFSRAEDVLEQQCNLGAYLSSLYEDVQAVVFEPR